MEYGIIFLSYYRISVKMWIMPDLVNNPYPESIWDRGIKDQSSVYYK